jgi:hypothetical protein
MMKAKITFLMLGFMLSLAACDQPRPTCYPISGQPCSPDDPVHDLRAFWVPFT